jgi:predicted RNase H-like nuclease (RuvC/YqgF family)
MSEVFESGEKEMKKAFEEVTTRNVKTVIEYSKKTREIVREMELEIKRLGAELSAQKAIIEQFKIQLAGVQTKLFSSGTE